MTGLLAGLWELPSVDLAATNDSTAKTRAEELLERINELFEEPLSSLSSKKTSLVHSSRQLAAVPHVGVIRIQTRLPVADPAKITAAMVTALKCDKAVYVVLHCNHADELFGANRFLPRTQQSSPTMAT